MFFSSKKQETITKSLSFIAQVNLAETSLFDKENLFYANSGLLYFFYSAEQEVWVHRIAAALYVWRRATLAVALAIRIRAYKEQAIPLHARRRPTAAPARSLPPVQSFRSFRHAVGYR